MSRWTMKYLGLPLGGNPRPRALKFWDPVREGGNEASKLEGGIFI